MIKILILSPLFIFVLACSSQVYGQQRRKINKDSLTYTIKKETVSRHKKDSTEPSFVFKLPYSKINSPRGMYLKVINAKNNETVYSRGVGMQFISGAMVDTLGYFDRTKEHFIFRTDSIPPGNYLIKCKVFQENGEVLIIDKKQKL